MIILFKKCANFHFNRLAASSISGRLGVSESECERHIAWDIGIAAVCRLAADALDATLVTAELLAPCH